MYAYLNNLSMTLPEGNVMPAWPLLNEVIEISSTLKNDYSIDYLKVPDDFQNIKIANSNSINELLAFDDVNFDINNQQYIIDFLANRTLTNLDEVEQEILNEIENKNAWVTVRHLASNSQFLTGAYLLNMPVISFKTTSDFCVDNLPCVYIIEYSEKTKSKNVELVNIYQNNQVKKHLEFLISIKKDLFFGKDKWDPYTAPIWNSKTATLLEELDFPQSIDGRKDKKSELLEVGENIALLNCWIFHKELTKINSNRGQIRMVFISDSNSKVAYLSIDMKNAFGRFEHHDDKGRHLGEIDFKKGQFIPRGESKTGKDKKGYHDLKLNKL